MNRLGITLANTTKRCEKEREIDSTKNIVQEIESERENLME
jgi:hypothetical protein